MLTFYKQERARGDFGTGIAFVLRRILASPSFVFRPEREPAGLRPGTPYRVADVELASRLSFFLWSTIPDDQLMDLAVKGTLAQPDVLSQQVRRMLADPRADALVSNFAGQWLQLRNLRGIVPNSESFPDFDDNLRQAFRREAELFFESIMQRGPERPRSDDGRLHVRERAAGQALRHAKRRRQSFPSRAAD